MSENLAIQTSYERWSYRELEAGSWAIANVLRECQEFGNGPSEKPIAIYAKRSPALVVTLLGILRAGHPFVVLDPSYPAMRLAQCLNLIPCAALFNISGQPLPLAIAESLASNHAQLVTDLPAHKEQLLEWNATSDDIANVDLDRIGPDDTMYVAFTSGTTGKPKAIVGGQGPVSHFFAWQSKTFDISRKDRVSVLSGLAHDPLLRDILMPLWVGATICMPTQDCYEAPNRLYEWMLKNRISVTHLTPALAQLLLAQAGRKAFLPLESLRYAFFGGDVLRYRLVHLLAEYAPNATIVNCYGATETPQVVGYNVIERTDLILYSNNNLPANSIVPIGRGIDDCQLLVLNDQNQIAAPGEIGQICVRSPYLAKEILNSDGQVTGKFIRNPYLADPEDRVYLTGDLGFYLGDGNVVFKGRKDRQVKIRGYRVELEEIAQVLGQFPGIVQHYVDVEGEDDEEKRLVLYISTQPAVFAGTPNLRNLLADALPGYMVPARIVEIAQMPLTPNGKIDRIKLREFHPSHQRHEASSPYGNANVIELRLLEELRQIMFGRHIGLDDDLLQSGLSSLQAIAASCAIEEAYEIQLDISDILAQKTLRHLAHYLNLKLQLTKPEDIDYPKSGVSSSEIQRIGELNARMAMQTNFEANFARTDNPRATLIPRNENLLIGIRNRILQLIARIAPDLWRASLHRMRGVDIGRNVSIGYDTIIETSYPWLIHIGDNVNIGIRTTVIGHFRGMAPVAKGSFSVNIMDYSFIGPGVIILPNVTVGEGAVVAAGSVVSQSIPPYLFVQGNPAVPKAKCGLPLSGKTTYREFIEKLMPI